MMLVAASPPAWAKAEPSALVQMEKYCIASWRNARIDMQEWDDCTQQTLVDLLSRIPRERLGVAIENPDSWERRELTRSIWCTVQRVRRTRHTATLDPCMAPTVADESHDGLESEEFREILCSDQAGLSNRQQSILMHVLEGYSVKEIADELNIPASRVSDEKYKAIQKLRKHFDVVA